METIDGLIRDAIRNTFLDVIRDHLSLRVKESWDGIPEGGDCGTPYEIELVMKDARHPRGESMLSTVKIQTPGR